MSTGLGLMNRPDFRQLGLSSTVMNEGRLGGSVHIALPKADAALRHTANQGIASWRADGTCHRIVRRHFPFSLD